MPNVFVKKSAEELYVELSDGRMMSFEELVKDYERLLKVESSKKATTSKTKGKKATTSATKGKEVATTESKADKSAVSKLKVGEWFRIDRNVIKENRDEIYRKCIDEGPIGETLWKRFEESNKIADDYPYQYPRLIETYIFKHSWDYKTEKQMRDMCEEVGDGMCDEIICDLELQMRICNGESAADLFKKADKLPRARYIKLRDGGSGFFGGSADFYSDYDPSILEKSKYFPREMNEINTPYAFRRVSSDE